MTSGSRLVIPQAMSRLWPITTPGTPEKVKPLTSNGQSSSTVRQCSPIWYQMPGIEAFEVRVVGQQRLARDGVIAGDHPAVGADAVAAAHQVGDRVDAAAYGVERLQRTVPECRPGAVAPALAVGGRSTIGACRS